MDLSQTGTSKAFFERIVPHLGDGKLIITICAAYEVEQNSIEMYQILHSQRSNIMELLNLVDDTDLPVGEKQNYSNALMNLLATLDYQGLLNPSSRVYQSNIGPVLRDLDYLAGRLSLYRSVDVEMIENLNKLSEKLGEILDQVKASQISLHDRIHVVEALNTLIFFVNNIEIAGAKRAWEKAILAFCEVSAVTLKAEKKSKSILKTTLAVVAATTGILASINGLWTEGTKTKEIMIEAYESGTKLLAGQQLLIEDKTVQRGDGPNGPDADEGVTVESD